MSHSSVWQPMSNAIVSGTEDHTPEEEPQANSTPRKMSASEPKRSDRVRRANVLISGPEWHDCSQDMRLCAVHAAATPCIKEGEQEERQLPKTEYELSCPLSPTSRACSSYSSTSSPILSPSIYSANTWYLDPIDSAFASFFFSTLIHKHSRSVDLDATL